MIFLCGVMIAAGTGCKNENAPENQTVQKRHLVIKVQGDEGQPTKVSPRRVAQATITDEGTTLSSLWTMGDYATYCNLSRQDGSNAYTGTLTAASTSVSTDLNGDVTCTTDDYLAVVYPATNTFVYNDPGTTYTYTFPLSGQDGTLATLATSYHQVYGRAHVLSVNGNNAEAVMPKMQSLLTICKFSFKDKTTNAAIPVKTLTISYGGAGSDANKYPQSATVTVTVLDENEAVDAQRKNVSAPLTITCPSEQNEVYVALLPEIASRIYNFSVTNGNGTYTGTAEALLKKGEYVPATGLKLEAN